MRSIAITHDVSRRENARWQAPLRCISLSDIIIDNSSSNRSRSRSRSRNRNRNSSGSNSGGEKAPDTAAKTTTMAI